VREWNPRAGRLEHEIAGPAEHPPVYSADRRRFATYSSSAVMSVDATSGKPIRPNVIDAGHSGAVKGIAVSPDGKRIATWGLDTEVRLWNADTGQPLCRVRAPWGHGCVTFLRDTQSFIAVAEDFVTPVVYDASGREQRRFVVPPEMAKAEMTR